MVVNEKLTPTTEVYFESYQPVETEHLGIVQVDRQSADWITLRPVMGERAMKRYLFTRGANPFVPDRSWHIGSVDFAGGLRHLFELSESEE